MTAVLGLDVGGTSLKLGLVDGDGTVLARARLPYAGFADYDALLATVADCASQVLADAGRQAAALGVATPGYARPEDGALVDGTANVPLLRGRCFGPDLGRRLGLPAATLNDGSAAALGEWRHGAGRGLDRFAVLTFGTGVGGGIVVDGRVLLGEGGIPPELGAIVLHDGPPGTQRTLEEFCCASGLARAYAEAGGHPGSDAAATFSRAAAGDRAAQAALDATARRIAQGCGTLVNALNLQACILGGGLAAAGEALRDRVAAALPDFCWPYLLARTELRLAVLSAEAGMVGAAAHARAACGVNAADPG